MLCRRAFWVGLRGGCFAVTSGRISGPAKQLGVATRIRFSNVGRHSDIRCASTRVGDHNVDTRSMQQLYAALKLSTFSDAELARAFQTADSTASGKLSRSDVRALFLPEHHGQLADTERERAERVTDSVMQRFTGKIDGTILAEDFLVNIKRFALERDSRVWPIAGMMLVAGIAVGVVLPVMPLLVQSMGLSAAEYGTVVSAFGLAKLVSNVPSAMMVTRLGRRATMSIGLAVVGFGMLGVGCANNLAMLLGARLISGVGVSALLSGATMAVADISTPLNRARMMAPMTTAFSAGTVLGPAIGGITTEWLGVSATFASVSAIFFLNALGTRFMTADTTPTPVVHRAASKAATQAGPVNGSASASNAAGVADEFRRVVSQWRPLWADPRLRGALLLNACYWASLAGTSMTLLPLILTSSKFGLSGAAVGALFAMQAAISVVGAVPAAALADRVGPSRVLAPALAISALGMVSFSLSTDFGLAAMSMGVWALGSTVLGSAPTANAANLVEADVRPQALALMRTMGDLGLLVGASSIGAVATVVGSEAAIQATAAMLVVAAAHYQMRMRGLAERH